MHPQPGTILAIIRLSSPVDLSQNTWVSFDFCGAYPKSNSDSGIVRFDSADAGAARAASEKQNASPIMAHLVNGFNIFYLLFLRVS